MRELKENEVIIEGKVISNYYGTSSYDRKNKKYRIAVEIEEPTRKAMRELYAKFSKSKLVPDWVNDDDKFIINFKSSFEIKTKSKDRSIKNLSEVCPGAIIKTCVRFKEQGFYPTSIYVIENGEPIDEFDMYE